MYESCVCPQMVSSQVFQGARCFACLVFFWDHAARKDRQGTFGSDKSHEVRGALPWCRGTFCATCRCLPMAKDQTNNMGPVHVEITFRSFDLKVYLTAVLFSICAKRILDTCGLNPSPMAKTPDSPKASSIGWSCADFWHICQLTCRSYAPWQFVCFCWIRIYE